MNSLTPSQKNPKVLYWIALIILFAISLISGIAGYQKYFILNNENFDGLRVLYCTLQLFVIENGDVPGIIPWELQLARFAAPLTAIMTLIMALMEIFREQWRRFSISLMRNHVVIIGLGTKGKNVMEEMLGKKERALVIEKDHLNPYIASVKPPRSQLLQGDATNLSTLKKARITKAKTVWLLMGDDADQANACLNIYNLIKASNRTSDNPLNCIMHLQNQEFLNTIRANPLVKDINDGLLLNIFNVYESSARDLFEENPPDRTGIGIDSASFVQMFIFGFGLMGEAIALQTALTGHYLNGMKPVVIIIDKEAKAKVPNFLDRYPDYEKFCTLKYLAIDAKSPQLIHLLHPYLENPDAFNTMVLAFDGKMQNLFLGLQLGNILNEDIQNVPLVLIRTGDNSAYDDLSKRITIFGSPSKICSQDVIMGGDLDRKAMALHRQYYNQRRKEIDFGQREADVPWNELSQEFKDSNRKAADHIGVKIRGIGCEVVWENDPRPEAKISEEDLERLSILEHKRWNAERTLSGWTYSEERNDQLRRTPFLTEWDNLTEKVKNYDRDAVKSIADVLRLVGLKIVKQTT